MYSAYRWKKESSEKVQVKEKLFVTAYSLEHITFHTKLLAKVEQGEKREPQKFITNLNIHKKSLSKP